MANTVRHFFVSRRGDMLPRWIEAFPAALPLRIGAKAPNISEQSIAWVRVTDEPVAKTLEAVRRILGGDVACVVLADQPDDEQAMASFAAAAKGYCNTHAAPELLRRIADVVTQGGLWIGESLMHRLMRATIHLPPSAAPAVVAATAWDVGLTEREREVALAVAAGASNKEIARSLDITERTIKAHVGATLEKLGVRDRLQLSLVVNGHRSR